MPLQALRRLQQIKWAKETALYEEDSISDYGSVLNSVRRLDNLDAETPNGAVPGPSRSLPLQRPASGIAISSNPTSSFPASSSMLASDEDYSVRDSAAVSFTQSPVRTLSPTNVVVDEGHDIGGDVCDGGDNATQGDDLSAAAPAAAAAAESSEGQVLIRNRSSRRSRDVVCQFISRQTTFDSSTGELRGC